jgi:CheY-like chemotaxis protein
MSAALDSKAKSLHLAAGRVFVADQEGQDRWLVSCPTPRVGSTMPSQATAVIAVAPPEAGPPVLLVDDQECCLRLLCHLIETAGWPCATSLTGADALVYCDALEPLAVVTDLAMPGIDGGVLAHWLKARYPSLPLILVTGEDLDEATLGGLRVCFSAILPKPVNPAILIECLEQLLVASQAADASIGLA